MYFFITTMPAALYEAIMLQKVTERGYISPTGKEFSTQPNSTKTGI